MITLSYHAYADGGTWRTTCTKQIACPAGQTGSITISTTFNNSGGVSCSSSSIYWGNAKQVSNTCVNSAPTLTRTASETRIYNCPAGQVGIITQSRSYEVWSDNSLRNYSAWSFVSNSCSIPAPTPNTVIRKEACPEGYTGYKQYKWVIKYKDVSYQATDTEGKLTTYTLSTPYQEEVLDVNTCTLIPTQNTVIKQGTKTQTCDSYYNAPAGSYSGDVVKTGNYVTTYDSNTKTSNTVFVQVGNDDISSCVAKTSNMSLEFMTAACDSGQTGNKTLYRYVYTDSSGKTSYSPNSSWEIYSSNCQLPLDEDTTDNQTNKTTPSLISNMSITSTQLSNNNLYNDFMKNIQSKSWQKTEGDTYHLNIVIDDLSTSVYNKTRMTNAIKTFDSIIGSSSDNFKIVSIPKSLDKYIGNGGITNINNKYLKSAIINENNQVEATYIDLSIKDSNGLPAVKNFTVQLFDSLSQNIQSNDRARN